ncbi:hypothetical protein BpHYR1_015347 [Brachionus plicatilis]|uniref:Uncharacterized protein n=1 Tax=Brachionus plicatilis TaxID=10195 RepID=A0A3M7T5A4_BRAPC|nr:hypothetical protein BpHYR1_015347 [Brachionus plicatilis]
MNLINHFKEYYEFKSAVFKKIKGHHFKFISIKGFVLKPKIIKPKTSVGYKMFCDKTTFSSLFSLLSAMINLAIISF